jgi:hypothetical protein
VSRGERGQAVAPPWGTSWDRSWGPGPPVRERLASWAGPCGTAPLTGRRIGSARPWRRGSSAGAVMGFAWP